MSNLMLVGLSNREINHTIQRLSGNMWWPRRDLYNHVKTTLIDCPTKSKTGAESRSAPLGLPNLFQSPPWLTKALPRTAVFRAFQHPEKQNRADIAQYDGVGLSNFGELL